jgi:hypothetical protein
VTHTQTKGRKCSGKRRYATEPKALAVVRRRISQGAAPDTLDAYPCEFCDGYHVGHRPPQKGRRRT